MTCTCQMITNGKLVCMCVFVHAGLARCKYKTVLSTKKVTAGTFAYMAPEAFSQECGGVTCKADVYSFGIMLK